MKITQTPYPQGEEIGIFKMSITYVQEGDGNKMEEEDNFITISTEDIPSDDGEEHYIVISTERWAINDDNEITELVNDFKNRLYNKKNETD